MLPTTNEADGLVSELAEVQELQKKMSQLLRKVAQRGARRVKEVEAEDGAAQIPVKGPPDFADLQDLLEEPLQEATSDGLEFEGSESEDPQRSCPVPDSVLPHTFLSKNTVATVALLT